MTADTNVLVRAVMGDDPVQSPAAAAALQGASLIAIPTPVLCEFVWVLSRAYRRPISEIAGAIERLLASETVAVDRPTVEAGLAFMDAGGDFADGCIAASGRSLGGTVLVTFDERAAAIARQLGGEVMLPERAG